MADMSKERVPTALAVVAKRPSVLARRSEVSFFMVARGWLSDEKRREVFGRREMRREEGETDGIT
jgi:hypothetical protein